MSAPLQPEPDTPRRVLDSSGKGWFTVWGVSYGAGFEEVTPPSCGSSGGTVLTRDSTDWDARVTLDPQHRDMDTLWVRTTKREDRSCGIGYNPGGDPIVGGDIRVEATTPPGVEDFAFFAPVPADSWTTRTSTGIPATTTLYFDAVPRSGFIFMYWSIQRPDGTRYRDYNAQITRSAAADEWEYVAEFKASSGTGSGGGGDPIDKCDDPSVPGCEGGN